MTEAPVVGDQGPVIVFHVPDLLLFDLSQSRGSLIGCFCYHFRKKFFQAPPLEQKCRSLTDSQRRQICECYDDDPDKTLNCVVNEFNTCCEAVGMLLKEKDFGFKFQSVIQEFETGTASPVYTLLFPF
jgi:hypothetical protein